MTIDVSVTQRLSTAITAVSLAVPCGSSAGMPNSGQRKANCVSASYTARTWFGVRAMT
jgi:hypothetical protein